MPNTQSSGLVTSFFWVVLTQFLLATGGVAYGMFSDHGYPLHTMQVFFLTTAAFFVLINPQKGLGILKNPDSHFIVATSATLFAFYFAFFLIGVQATSPAAAQLVLSAEVCINGVIAAYVAHKKLDFSLVLFSVAIFIAIFL